AFASWMGGKTVHRLKPEWDAGWTAGRSRKSALEVDRLASARQIRNPVLEKGDIWAAFDSITYNKGAAVLSTFETWFTPACFREGTRTQCADIKSEAQRVPLAAAACPAWLTANPGGQSYYVPRYAPALAQQLRANVAALSADEMLATTVDAGILAQSGLIGIGEALAWANAGLDHPSLL